MKKVISILLAMTLLFSVNSFAASGDSENTPKVEIVTNPADWQVVESFGMKTALVNGSAADIAGEKPYLFDNKNAVTNCADLLLGSPMIQTTFSYDKNVIGTDIPEDTAFASISINHPADIYISVDHRNWNDGSDLSIPQKPLSASYLPWLRENTTAPFGGYERAVTADGKPAYLHLSSGRVLHIYKKTVDVAEGETKLVEFGGLGEQCLMYTVFVVWKDVYQANLTKTEHGTVTFNGTSLETGSSTRILAGENAAFQITPDEGYYIDWVKVDGQTVAEKQTEEYLLTMQPTADTVIEVSFSDSYPDEHSIKQKMKNDFSTGLVIPTVELSGLTSTLLTGKILDIEITQKENGAKETLQAPVDGAGAYFTEFFPSLPGDYTAKLSVIFSAATQKELWTEDFTVASVEKINQLLTDLNSPERITAEEFAERITENAAEYGFETELFPLLSAQQQKKICENILQDNNQYNAELLLERYETNLKKVCFSNNVSTAAIEKALEMYVQEMAIQGTDRYQDYIKMAGEEKAKALEPMLNQEYADLNAVSAAFTQSIVLYQYHAAALQGELLSIFSDNAVILGQEPIATFLNYSSGRQTAILKYLMNQQKKISTFAKLQSEIQYAVENIKESTGGGGGGGGTKPSGGGSSTPSVTVKDDNVPKPPQDQKTSPFQDVADTYWGANAIDYLYTKGVVAGKEDLLFHPEDAVTRAEFLKMLMEWYDLTNAEASCDFEDVPKEHWAYSYIASAHALEIVSGTDANTFLPDSTISREDMSVMTYRLLESKGILPSEESNKTHSFIDQKEIASYALNAVKALGAYGIIRGFEDNSYQPKKTVTRAEAAQIIYNAATNSHINDSYYNDLVEKKYRSDQPSSQDPTWETSDYVQGEMPAQYIPRPEYQPSADEISVIYKGETQFFGTKPLLRDDRVMMPVRNAFGIFGMDISWNAETQTAICRNDAYTIEITADKTSATVNGEEFSFDVASFIVDGRLYVPLRFIGEAVGANVSWDEGKKAVIIR